jgi:hypothetical protein
MLALRGALPLILAGTTGIALVGFGVTGLSGVEPDLARAARTVQQQRTTPVAPNRLVDCPPQHRGDRDEV